MANRGRNDEVASSDVVADGVLGDNAVVTSERSRAATIVVSLIALVCVVATIQVVIDRLGQSEPVDQVANDTVPSTTPNAARSQSATTTTTETSTDVETPTFVPGEPNADLALGQPFVIAVGDYDTGDVLVDLTDGSTLTLDGYKALAITEHFVVAATLDSLTGYGNPTLVRVVDRRTGASAPIEVSWPVYLARRGTGADDVWLWGEGVNGFRYVLYDLMSPGTEIQRIESPGYGWLKERPGQDPYVNVGAVGVYEATREGMRFVDRGEIVAASTGGAVWSLCDEAMVCSTTLRRDGETIPLDVPTPSWGYDGVAQLSPDGRYLATLSTANDGIGFVVYDLETGSQIEAPLSVVWTTDRLTFAGHYLLGLGQSGLVVFDLETGTATDVVVGDGFLDTIIVGPALDG